LAEQNPTNSAWAWDTMQPAYVGDSYEERVVETAGTIVSRFRVDGPNDFVEEFEALPGGWCSSSHFGFVIKGSARVIPADGGESVTIREGDAYYQAPGHRVEFLEASELLEFSPASEWWEVVTYLNEGKPSDG
jgi:hypothetical protein